MVDTDRRRLRVIHHKREIVVAVEGQGIGPGFQMVHHIRQIGEGGLGILPLGMFLLPRHFILWGSVVGFTRLGAIGMVGAYCFRMATS